MAAAGPTGAPPRSGKTPVTMLSGFLGSGKTTLLRYLLENSTEKIACIVNDVASINIDAKLVRNDRNRSREEGVNSTADLADTIELANGCACCNLQDELFASFESVLAMGDKRGEPYARIVLENSGIAEPQAIREKFAEAAAAGHPLLGRIELDAMVTLVDSGTFIADYASRTPVAARPELGEGGNMRPVVDLLVEQIECADFIVLNKSDLLAGEDKRAQLAAIVASLNPLARVFACERGRVAIEQVFGSTAHAVVAKLTIEGQHRGAVAAARSVEAEAAAAAAHDHAHSHDHTHDHGHAHSHDHGHGHDHSHSHEHECKGDGCGHESHAHGAGHGAGHDHECAGEQCSHEAHSHGHHGHGHGHEHTGDDCAVCSSSGPPAPASNKATETRAKQRFGIHSFVYCRRRPFHPQRLREMVLKWLPVTSNTALEGDAPGSGDSPIRAVLRSKGFVWMSNSHSTAFYWSHAGGHFEVKDEGDWWAAVEDGEWPSEPAQRQQLLADFDAASGFGDRRQEVVFIGVNMDQAAICQLMDGALLSDEELERYVAKWGADADPAHPELEALKRQRTE